MSRKNLKTIQIAFNIDDPYQKKLYDYVKEQTSNVSLYGKSLIQKDMAGSWVNRNDEADRPIEDAIEIDYSNFI
jgi:beta-xylosidase